jgi:hypothetical protein
MIERRFNELEFIGQWEITACPKSILSSAHQMCYFEFQAERELIIVIYDYFRNMIKIFRSLFRE